MVFRCKCRDSKSAPGSIVRYQNTALKFGEYLPAPVSCIKTALSNLLSASRTHHVKRVFLVSMPCIPLYCLEDSGFNEMLETTACETEGQVYPVLTQWYIVCHSINAFAIREEPFPGIYDCRFCGEDLSEPHHAHEHTHACAKEAATQEATRILDLVSCPSIPCQFQLALKGKFVPCGAIFTSHDERGEHMRSHVRYMTKRDDDGNKQLTCYFGECTSYKKKFEQV